MAGHSHWNNIKRKKEATDAKKAKEFTKLAKAITHAAREGGGDPDFNPTLSTMVDKAKAANLPKDRIEKAIKVGTGEINTGPLESITYEGYGPEGVAFMVTTLTDNRNRTVAEIRNIFSKHNGSLGTTGSAAYVFGEDPENPQFLVEISDQSVANILIDLAETLDDHDDVQGVYTNFDIVTE